MDDLDNIEQYYKENLENIKNDISNIDIKCDRLENHILSLEMNINRIESLIQNSQGADKGKLYAVLNNTMSILNEYQRTQISFLDLKYKYRKESNDVRTQIVRMEKLELPKLSKSDTEYNITDLVKSLNNIGNTNSSVLIEELNNNNDYKL